MFQHHIASYGPQAYFGYKDFIPQFTASKFDANAWAKLFHDSGVKFVMPVESTTTGFQMYDSDLTEYSAAKMDPNRDVVGELVKAIRGQKMQCNPHATKSLVCVIGRWSQKLAWTGNSMFPECRANALRRELTRGARPRREAERVR